MSDRGLLEQLKSVSRRSGWAWTATLVFDRLGIPAIRFWKEWRVAPDALQRQVSSILQGWGLPEDHVAVVVRHMLYPDLHGIDSHGCAMLLQYLRWKQEGKLLVRPDIRLIRENETTGLLDGGGAMGHIPADRAMKMAIDKCRTSGLSATAVRNSGHFGSAGSYAAMAADAGLIGLATTNVRVPALVPTFGIQARLGTNPIAFAAPAGRNRPFLLDMATSTVPVGKLMTAWRGGRSIPRGWAMDPRGHPATHPRRAFNSRLLTPLGGEYETGGHKGYGLAAMVEILSAVLPGEFHSGGVGHFFLALDPDSFLGTDSFRASLDELMDDLRETQPKSADRDVQVAGDPEYAAQEHISEAGICLNRCVIEDMRTVCEDSAVPFMLEPVTCA